MWHRQVVQERLIDIVKSDEKIRDSQSSESLALPLTVKEIVLSSGMHCTNAQLEF